MKINFEKIKEIYGEEILEALKNQSEEVAKNLNYFISLGFNDVEDILEREALLFLLSSEEFKDKIDGLIEKLGENYVEEIENNLDIFEELQ